MPVRIPTAVDDAGSSSNSIKAIPELYLELTFLDADVLCPVGEALQKPA